jgi:hypothetical protein
MVRRPLDSFAILYGRCVRLVEVSTTVGSDVVVVVVGGVVIRPQIVLVLLSHAFVVVVVHRQNLRQDLFELRVQNGRQRTAYHPVPYRLLRRHDGVIVMILRRP